MFSSKKPLKNNAPHHVVTTVVGEDSEFTGTINSQGSVRIEGKLEGKINAQGDVFIGEKSKVRADIVGKRVLVSGEVNGNIEAMHGLEIMASGRVFGDVTGDRLIVEEGAVYKGKVNMDVITSASETGVKYDFQPKLTSYAGNRSNTNSDVVSEKTRRQADPVLVGVI